MPKTIKKAAKKKGTAKKSAAKKTALMKTQTKSAATKLPKKTTAAIEPGPPPRAIPPVEEPISQETALGTVTHYYSHLGVAVVQINTGVLTIGDTVHIKGHVTDFSQTIDSMEYEHQHVEQASAGQTVGLKTTSPMRQHDIVFIVKS